jgi:hypothetical protein
MSLKMMLIDNSNERVIRVNEVSGSLMGLPPVGTKGPDSVYVVNYMQNNVFSGEDINGLALADSPKLNRILTRDKTGKLKETSGVKFLSNCKYNLYKVSGITEEQKLEIKNHIGDFVEENFLYKTLFNKEMYTYDQIACEASAESILDFYTYMDKFSTSVDESIDKLVNDR